MDADPRNHSAPGPSPEEAFSDWPALRPIDHLLDREARTHLIPDGLSERIFRASVERLPQRETARPRRRSLLLAPLVPGRFTLWGRLAMAASIALVFVFAMQIQGPALRPEPRGLELAVLTPDEELVLLDVDSRIESLFATGDVASMGEGEHIVFTRDMTFRDLRDDVLMLASDMEM